MACIGVSKQARVSAFVVSCILFASAWLPLTELHSAEAGCEVVNYCSSAAADPDGDGWGWENQKSCIRRGGEPDPNRGKRCTAPGARTQPSQLNPNFFYFFNGEIPGGRSFTLGDDKNWNVPVRDLKGRSATGKITVQPEDYQGTGDALNAVWTGKAGKGQLALYGDPLNISAIKDKAALVVDLQLKRKPSDRVTFSLDCEWPCRGDFEASHILRKMPTKKWVTLPIPLNCFRGETFDLSRINGFFLLSTEGRMELSLANIRIERLEEGNPGCTD